MSSPVLKRLNLKSAFWGVVLLTAWGILSVVLGQPKEGDYSGGWDFEAIWLGPYVLTQGESPYDSAIWLREHEKYDFAPKNNYFLYPLPFAILLLPIGLLPLRVAAVVWAALTLGLVLFSAYLILKPHGRLKIGYLIPILTGVFFFRPVAVLIYILQLDALIVFWVVLAWYLWLHDRWFLGGMALALTALKPQVGAPLLFFLGLWQVFRWRWRAILGEVIALVGLLVLGLAFDLTWVGRWLAIGGDKTIQNFYSTPTLWGLTALVCKPSLACIQWMGAILSIVTAALVLWVILRRPIEDLTYVTGTVLCGALFISPYLWSYSQLLLILPLLSITVALYRMHRPYLVVAGFPLFMALISFGLLGVSIGIGADLASALLPLLVWALLFLVYRKDPQLLRREG